MRTKLITCVVLSALALAGAAYAADTPAKNPAQKHDISGSVLVEGKRYDLLFLKDAAAQAQIAGFNKALQASNGGHIGSCSRVIDLAPADSAGGGKTAHGFGGICDFTGKTRTAQALVCLGGATAPLKIDVRAETSTAADLVGFVNSDCLNAPVK
ncbi:MAG: hypothetical protein GC185_03780 [Alphaproteobacteria bacterium]|nr:hypothetical protein [Alphaproteobacteria bacterium]